MKYVYYIEGQDNIGKSTRVITGGWIYTIPPFSLRI